MSKTNRRKTHFLVLDYNYEYFVNLKTVVFYINKHVFYINKTLVLQCTFCIHRLCQNIMTAMVIVKSSLLLLSIHSYISVKFPHKKPSLISVH